MGENIAHPEAHMDMILFEVFLKNIHLIPQDQIWSDVPNINIIKLN